MTPFDLTDRTALVTGASRGIGAAICTALARSGADVIGVSSSLPDDGGDVGAAVRDAGRRFDAISCDLGDRAAIHAMLEELADRRIDILVNNAGIIRRGPVAEHSDADWDAVMAVNLDAPFLLTREIGRGMLARGDGKVIFVASVLSFQGGITVPGYAAAKGGIAQLTKAFANEWAAQGVNVNAIAPGYVATDNTAALQSDPEREAQLMARVPAGRWGRPEEIADPVVFLASDAARFVHGTVLSVDGGWLGR
ncbi:SDR family oxidoreductase [Psychromarinibacter sp. C21-152]|uniref:SDR family oxidoreductase n=1 Tax=Psychromarinibacter sediminicola TaxID=3033385 RepID=A0AAE3T9A7_9RHOB|nr:SDR family oxidoreductase [Psychromarinibacter sediminicola]MDF0601658.1 SDR family oxidoreductase [Psychromarinibacter sediminicola]